MFLEPINNRTSSFKMGIRKQGIHGNSVGSYCSVPRCLMIGTFDHVLTRSDNQYRCEQKSAVRPVLDHIVDKLID